MHSMAFPDDVGSIRWGRSRSPKAWGPWWKVEPGHAIKRDRSDSWKVNYDWSLSSWAWDFNWPHIVSFIFKDDWTGSSRCEAWDFKRQPWFLKHSQCGPHLWLRFSHLSHLSAQESGILDEHSPPRTLTRRALTYKRRKRRWFPMPWSPWWDMDGLDGGGRAHCIFPWSTPKNLIGIESKEIPGLPR